VNKLSQNLWITAITIAASCDIPPTEKVENPANVENSTTKITETTYQAIKSAIILDDNKCSWGQIIAQEQ
jgi:hypothetical protein